ncbi:MAG: hypothetical protein A2W99_05235 [Bacteroidetes bacterium GWF2_33_16]|nr:MAG: hypothetical protein A2X00_17755 [Bacteroidetes bacterium GWE2_32_14]OFY06065.1 MAG: hypothetical protein A2W99_05235 [Bacteroidetes bacterium GWF2_33_16]
MIRKLILVVLFIVPLFLQAQNQTINCEFDDIEKYRRSNEENTRFSFDMLKDERYVEFLLEGEQLAKYETIKRIIKINDERAINIFNKFSIPFSDLFDITDIKVRTVNTDGKIYDLDKSTIKEVENLDEEGNYKKFAIDGVEIGSLIEINYTTKKAPRLYGGYNFQNDGNTYNALLQIISPKHLHFDAKSYNKAFTKNDTIIEDKRYLTLTCEKIDPLDDEEEYSFPEANKARVEYSYRLNVEYHKVPYYTYNLATQNIYNAFYQIDKNEIKSIEKLIDKMKISGSNENERIKYIETFIKEKYLIRPIDNIENGENIVQIIKNGYSSEIGITKLFANVFKFSGIEHNIVTTSNRKEKRFDKDFMTWNYLYDYLLYFPKTNQLLAPTRIEFRYPSIPTEYHNNDGLFLNLVKIGDMESAIHKFKPIPGHNFEKSFINHYININFSEDFDQVLTNLTHSFGGDAAYTIKPYYAFAPQEQKDIMMKNFIKTLADDMEIIDYKVENADLNDDPFEKPFNIVANIKISSFIENAGNNYLFKIGELIGRQVELYQEHERQQPMDIDYPHILERVIKINIPEGYKVLGAEKLKFDIHGGNDSSTGKPSMGFVSDYEINGNELTVKIYEYYSIYQYPIEEYEQFREVINAAADFTKVVIVFCQ